MAGEQADRANQTRKADEARRAATTGGSYAGAPGIAAGLGRALRPAAAQFAEGLGVGGAGGLDIAAFQRQVESEVTKAVSTMFQTITSAVSSAATKAIRDMQTQVNSVTAQTQLYAGMTPQAAAAVFAQPQRRQAGAGTPAMQSVGMSPAMASGAASPIMINPPGANVGGSQYISGGYVSAAQRGNPNLWPTGPIAGGPAGLAPTGPTAAGQYPMFPVQHTMFAAPPGAYTSLGAAPPGPPPPGTGSPFAGYGIGGFGSAARTIGGAVGPAALAVGGAGAAAYYRGVTGALDDERRAIIGASRLQTLIGNAQTPEDFRQQLGFGPRSEGVSRYGYTQAQMQAAGYAYLPYAPGAGTGAINALAGYGEGTGVGLQGAAQFYGNAARAGAVGVPGGMGFSQFMGMTSAAMGASTLAKPEDWMAGFSDLLRQQQMMTITMDPNQTKALTGYYGALNTSGVAGLAGTQGAAVLGGLSQGIAGAMQSSPAVQTMWYQALGGGRGMSPALATLITQGGLSTTTYGGRTYDPLRQGMQYIQQQYGQQGDLDRWWAMSQMFHVSMPTAKALAGANLFTKAGQVTAAEGEFQHLLSTSGIDLTTATGASTARFLGEIANADLIKDPRRRQAAWTKVAGDMRTARVAGVPGTVTGGVQLAQALAAGGVTTQAGINQTYLNNLGTALQNAADQINTFAGNVKLAAAHIVDTTTQIPGATAVGVGVGGVAQGVLGMFGFGAGGQVARAVLSRLGGGGAAATAASRVGGGAATVGRGVGGRALGLGGNLLRGLAGAALGDAAIGAGIGLAAGTAVGVGGSWLWNEHQKDLHKTDVNAFLADMKGRHIQGNWSQVSTGLFGLGHPGLQYKGARGSYTIDIGNLAHDPTTGEWYDKTTGTKVDLGTIGQPSITGGGGHGVETHTRAATRRTTDLAASVLDPRRPLPTSTEQQLRTDLQNFIRDYGNVLIRWQRSALSSLSGATDGGGTDGTTNASYGGDTYRTNTLGGYNVTAAQGTNISGAGLQFGSYRDVREVGPVFNVGAGNPVTLPEGGRYDATRSTAYNSIFVTPEGQAVSFLHMKARKFSNNQFVSAGTVIGQGLPHGGTFSGRTSTGSVWTGGMTGPGLVEMDVFNAAQGQSAAAQAFARPEGGVGTGEVDVMNWLATRQGHGTSGSGAVMDILRDESRKFGIPLNILVAQATRESSMGTNEVQGNGGGRGLFQFDFSQPANIRNAAKWLGQAAGLGPNISEAKARQLAMNNRINAMASGAMMQSLYNQYGSWSAALTAYNTGGPGGDPTYANAIMQNANPIGGGHGVPVEHPSHPHHQKTVAKQANTSPVLNIGNMTVEITLPNGTVEKIQGCRVKFDGVAGLHVQTGHAKQVSQFHKSPKR